MSAFQIMHIRCCRPVPLLRLSACLEAPPVNPRRRQLFCQAGDTLLAVAAGGLVLTMAAGTAAAASSGRSAAALTKRGMEMFKKGKLAESLQQFDAAIAADPDIRPYIWQRGLTLYYMEQFEAAAQQFRADVAVNPDDTEEAIWAFLAEAALEGSPEAARLRFLQVGRDPRPVMRLAQQCFEQGTEPAPLEDMAIQDPQGSSGFYALLYKGLWHEAQGQPQDARRAVVASTQTRYAKLSGDYMAALARVHCQVRGWQ